MLPNYWPLGQARLERTAGRFAIEKNIGYRDGYWGSWKNALPHLG